MTTASSNACTPATSCNNSNNNNNHVETETTPNDDAVIEEDDWGLPCNFFLFAQHQVRNVYLMRDSNNNDSNNDSSNKALLQVWCVQALTPLDMVHLGYGVHDATAHCCWTACFWWIAALPWVWHELLQQQQQQQQQQQSDEKDLRVVELGSGTGLGGLALWKHHHHHHHHSQEKKKPNIHLHVTLTDADPQALDLCRRNVELNRVHDNDVAVQELTWGQEPVPSPLQHTMDVILATDILYDIRLLPDIVKTATDCANPRGRKVTFYLAHVPRACYNATTQPNAPEVLDLEAYIVQQVQVPGFWRHQQTWRPLDVTTTTTATSRREHYHSWQPPRDCINHMSLSEMQDVGAALFVFQHDET